MLDDWSSAGLRIDSEECLRAIRSALEVSGPIVVEWRHYRGASSPHRLVFDDFEAFQEWLSGVKPGDSIWVWDFDRVCTSENALTHGKYPDSEGRVPAGGAY
jgi:hypothetical protein